MRTQPKGGYVIEPSWIRLRKSCLIRVADASNAQAKDCLSLYDNRLHQTVIRLTIRVLCLSFRLATFAVFVIFLLAGRAAFEDLASSFFAEPLLPGLQILLINGIFIVEQPFLVLLSPFLLCNIGSCEC